MVSRSLLCPDVCRYAAVTVESERRRRRDGFTLARSRRDRRGQHRFSAREKGCLPRRNRIRGDEDTRVRVSANKGQRLMLRHSIPSGNKSSAFSLREKVPGVSFLPIPHTLFRPARPPSPRSFYARVLRAESARHDLACTHARILFILSSFYTILVMPFVNTEAVVKTATLRVSGPSLTGNTRDA